MGRAHPYVTNLSVIGLGGLVQIVLGGVVGSNGYGMPIVETEMHI